jgi:host factor-I protein
MNHVGSQPSGQNIQDLFLNGARRNQMLVIIQLVDGACFDVTIKSFDRFSIVVDQGGFDRLIFKHAVATISPANATSAPPVTT